MKHAPLIEKPKIAPEPVPARQPMPAEEPKLAEELHKMQYEPMLPVEKKLVLWSVSLGVILLGLLMWASHTFFHG